MSPITHMLLSWTVAEGTGLDERDRNLITWCGVLPDADGVGIVVDLANRVFGRSPTFWYARLHHLWLHGIIGALLIAGCAGLLARRRVAVFGWALLAVHLHLLCDFVGSRGPDPTDIWPIHYLGPVSNALTLAWKNQWRLDAWPNLLTTLLLIAFVLVRTVQAGRSPVSMFSLSAHVAVTEALRARWRQLRG